MKASWAAVSYIKMAMFLSRADQKLSVGKESQSEMTEIKIDHSWENVAINGLTDHFVWQNEKANLQNQTTSRTLSWKMLMKFLSICHY